jgi:hypothetical protein
MVVCHQYSDALGGQGRLILRRAARDAMPLIAYLISGIAPE